MSIRTATHRTRRPAMVVAIAAIAVTVAACTDDARWRQADPPPATTPGRTAPPPTPVSLERVAGCDELADRARATFRAAAANSGVNGLDQLARVSGGIDRDELVAEESTSAAAPDDGAGAELTGTNNQEPGVEEADLVDLDNDRIVWVVNGVVQVAQLDDTVTVDGTLDLSDRGPSDLFLRGDRVLVLGTIHGAPPGDVASPPTARPTPDIARIGPTRTTLTVVSVEDPTAPTIVAATDVEGSLVTAREIDGVARVVLRSTLDAVDDAPAPTSSADAEELLDGLQGEQLLPRRWDDGEPGVLGTCNEVMVMPVEPDGGPGDGPVGPVIEPANVTVLRVGDDLGDLAPVTVQGAAETVYASTGALYVAAGNWDEQGWSTVVHRFDLTGDAPAAHTGSGSVPGRLLNQFALSERDGHLRVVTTVDGMVDSFDEPVPGEMVGEILPAHMSEGRLTVLDTDGALDEVGHVDGLGPNEEVHSVRFVEDLAYVVTFRRTDPLYAIDLTDPGHPTVLGELKITGFSEYLHPVGGGLLLGVGREVDESTGTDEGMKVSLFDVSDPTALGEVDRFVLPGTWSQVGSGDHRAFTWDPARNRAIIPTEAAALVVQVDGPTLTTVAELSHAGEFGTIGPDRTRIHDGTIWSISTNGLGRTPADAPATVEMLSR